MKFLSQTIQARTLPQRCLSLLLPLVLGVGMAVTSLAVNRFVVPAGGIAKGEGTQAAPWTLPYAFTAAKPGDVVFIQDKDLKGVVTTYKGRHVVGVSGTAGVPITFQAFPGETPIIDGTGAALPGVYGYLGLLHIASRSNLVFNGLELQNFVTRGTNTIMGIAVMGSCQNISFQNCKVHHITATLAGADAGNANGIGVYGQSGTLATSQINIDHCEIYSLITGYSESVTFNGNVDGFTFTNNIVRNCNNIGVDVIGYERTAPANDQARNGVISNNDIYLIDSIKNPAYRGVRSAAGIYVDGGRDVLIEANRIHECNFGVEIGSEARGGSSSNCIVRNNWIYGCHSHGVLLGGAESINGGASNALITNNTLFKNTAAGCCFQFHVSDTVVKNNILWAGASQSFVQHYSTTGIRNLVDWNCYYSDAFALKKGVGSWSWNNRAKAGFAAWKAATGFDANSCVGDPKLVSTVNTNGAVYDLHLRAASTAINAADPASTVQSGTKDIGGETRVLDGRPDLGADEYSPTTTSIVNELSTAAEYGETAGFIRIQRTGDALTPLKVNLNYVGTATNGTDVNLLPASVTIPAGTTSLRLEVKAKRDTLAEGLETLTPTLVADPAYTVGFPASTLMLVIDVPIDQWRRDKFPKDYMVAAIAGNSADPDKDGIVNLVEYAMGRNPLVFDVYGTPTPYVQNGYLTLVVTRNPSARDVSICPEVASNIDGPWVSGPAHINVIEDSTVRFRAQDKVPVLAATKRFMHLRVCLQ